VLPRGDAVLERASDAADGDADGDGALFAAAVAVPPAAVTATAAVRARRVLLRDKRRVLLDWSDKEFPRTRPESA
jgi:hypothetical protein